jgi:hypothetical protein
MNADTVAIIVKTTTSGAKTTTIVLYPLEAGDIFVNVTQWAGSATASGNVALKDTLAKGTELTGFNDLSAAQVNTECDTALADVGLSSTVTGRIDATISSRATQASVDAVKTKTDQLTFTAGGVEVNIDTGDLSAIADAILKRDWSAISGEAVYSLLNAARMLRNVWNTAGGTLTVKKEDGTTTAWTRTLATDPAAEPIIGAS